MITRENLLLVLTALLLGAAIGVAGAALTGRARPAPLIIATPMPTSTPTATPTPSPSATAGPITVHINGAVALPGVYQLPPASIVQTAVDMAGGLLPEANQAIVNLAQSLPDGAHLYIPTYLEAPQTPAAVVNPPESAPKDEMNPTFAVESGGALNINRASAAELEALPGVGPSTAAAIVHYRDEAGPFQTIDELLNVTGIGPAKFEQIRPFISVDG